MLDNMAAQETKIYKNVLGNRNVFLRKWQFVCV